VNVESNHCLNALANRGILHATLTVENASVHLYKFKNSIVCILYSQTNMYSDSFNISHIMAVYSL